MPRPDFTGAVDDDVVANGSVTARIVGAPPKPPPSPNVVAKPISIFDILPDPTQPRRAVPSRIRQNWKGQPQEASAVLSRWLASVKFTESEAYARAVIEGASKRDVDSERAVSSIEDSWLKLIGVAAGIWRDGLINPITVSQVGQVYRLETGERRWLAYHLLHLLYGEAWSRIPARLVESPSVWRQALENNARDNLNAIGRARQLAILIMDILGTDRFRPFETFENEREYYAQVADGDKFRVPRKHAERLLQAMGLKNTVQVRQYRALLRLNDDIWRVADDENWTENKLRKYVHNDEDTVTPVTVSAGDVPPAPGTDEHFSRLKTAVKKAGQGDIAARQTARQLAWEIIQWIDGSG